MSLKIYDTLAPQGNYPAVLAEDVEMPNGERLSNVTLGGQDVQSAVLYTKQTLTPEEQAQARENIGVDEHTTEYYSTERKEFTIEELGITEPTEKGKPVVLHDMKTKHIWGLFDKLIVKYPDRVQKVIWSSKYSRWEPIYPVFIDDGISNWFFYSFNENTKKWEKNIFTTENKIKKLDWIEDTSKPLWNEKEQILEKIIYNNETGVWEKAILGRDIAKIELKFLKDGTDDTWLSYDEYTGFKATATVKEIRIIWNFEESKWKIYKRDKVDNEWGWREYDLPEDEQSKYINNCSSFIIKKENEDEWWVDNGQGEIDLDFINYQYIISTGKYYTNGEYTVVHGLNEAVKKPIYLVEGSIDGQERKTTLSLYRFICDVLSGRITKGFMENAIIKTVPIVNPTGFDAFTRETKSGVKLNRDFNKAPDNTQKETKAIKNWIDSNEDADVFIDLHNSSAVNEIAVIICPKNSDISDEASKIAMRGLDHIIQFWRYIFKRDGITKLNTPYCVKNEHKKEIIFSNAANTDLPGAAMTYASTNKNIPAFVLELETYHGDIYEFEAAKAENRHSDVVYHPESIAIGTEALGNVLIEFYEQAFFGEVSEDMKVIDTKLDAIAGSADSINTNIEGLTDSVDGAAEKLNDLDETMTKIAEDTTSVSNDMQNIKSTLADILGILNGDGGNSGDSDDGDGGDTGDSGSSSNSNGFRWENGSVEITEDITFDTLVSNEDATVAFLCSDGSSNVTIKIDDNNKMQLRVPCSNGAKSIEFYANAETLSIIESTTKQEDGEGNVISPRWVGSVLGNFYALNIVARDRAPRSFMTAMKYEPALDEAKYNYGWVLGDAVLSGDNPNKTDETISITNTDGVEFVVRGVKAGTYHWTAYYWEDVTQESE